MKLGYNSQFMRHRSALLLSGAASALVIVTAVAALLYHQDSHRHGQAHAQAAQQTAQKPLTGSNGTPPSADQEQPSGKRSQANMVSAPACTVNAVAVNSCRPWLAAAVNGYDGAGPNVPSVQFSFYDKRLNDPSVLTSPSKAVTLTRKIDVPHFYDEAGTVMIPSGQLDAINNPNIVSSTANPVLINYKPSDNWATAAGGSVDNDIRQSARNVKAIAPRKVILSLYHEPEDNLDTSGEPITSGCNSHKAGNMIAGTAADYRAMWQHVHDIFAQEGVTNVVWSMNYMGYVNPGGTGGWACIEKDLWPGNNLVDWVMWDPYATTGDFTTSINRFIDYMNKNSDASHAFTSKVWGIAEMGSNTSPAVASQYWETGKAAIGSSWSTSQYPQIKLWAAFDTSINGGTNGGLRVGYDDNGAISVAEQTAYNDFASNILNFGDQAPAPSPEPAPSPAPAPSPSPNPSGDTGANGSTGQKDDQPPIETAKDGQTVSNLTVFDSANINNAQRVAQISQVDYLISGKVIQTVTKPPFALDTTKLANGTYTITERTILKDGSHDDVTRSISVRNASKVSPAPAKSHRLRDALLGYVVMVLIVCLSLLGYKLWQKRQASKTSSLPSSPPLV